MLFGAPPTSTVRVWLILYLIAQRRCKLTHHLYKDKKTNLPLISWPVYGYAYDVLIGGLYPNTKTEWDYGMRGLTFEIAVPVTQANKLLKRVRELFDESAAEGKAVTSTYRRFVTSLSFLVTLVSCR